MKKVEEILPELRLYLKKIEPICKDFPICCQESSIILYIWLIKNGIECTITAGDYNDPVIEDCSIHFWVETDKYIIDGTAVQFKLENYSRPRSFDEIENLIPETLFCFSKTDECYMHKIKAYINKELQELIVYIKDNSSYNFDKFMDEIKSYFIEYNQIIMTANKFMMFSSLYKNNKLFYGLNKKQFLEKCRNQGLDYAEKYIVTY